LHLGISVDAISGVALTIDEIGAEDAQTLKEWMEPVAKSVGAEVLVTDDADAFKTVADELGLEHQVCKSHVKRNTQDLISELEAKVAEDADGSLPPRRKPIWRTWASSSRAESQRRWYRCKKCRSVMHLHVLRKKEKKPRWRSAYAVCLPIVPSSGAV
jgi:hypothetical protein